MTDNPMPEYISRVRSYLDAPGTGSHTERIEALAKWIDREIRRAAERSLCCNSPMSGGVQCLVCGADGTDDGGEA